MLRPKKSLLAVFGLTRHVDRVRRLTDLVPCENCSFLPCQYRRAPYRRAPQSANPELVGDRRGDARRMPRADACAARSGMRNYTVNVKALQRWSDERLSLRAPAGRQRRRDVFRYEGTTCTNMGRPLQLRLPRHARPARGRLSDSGAALRAGARRRRAHLHVPLHEQPRAPDGGDRSGEAAARPAAQRRARPGRGRRPARAATASRTSRQHKWGLVLETIHFALARERGD